jgi:gas vesicle protein
LALLKKKMMKALYLILAGVAIGILVAPDKGSETWRKIKDSFDDWKDGAMDKVNDIVGQGNDVVDKAKDPAANLKTAVEKTVNEW